jgi:hypothetical protein
VESARRPRAPALIALVLSRLITAWYGVLALKVLRPEALYSIDAAVKYVQARSMLTHRFLAMPVENRAAFIDPEGTFLPFKPPYIFTRNGVRHLQARRRRPRELGASAGARRLDDAVVLRGAA